MCFISFSCETAFTKKIFSGHFMHQREIKINYLMLVLKDFNSVNIFYLEQLKQYLKQYPIDKVIQKDL